MRVKEMSTEDLLYRFSTMSALEVNYPKNKTYPKERHKLELELLRRLGGDIEKYKKLNGWQ